MLRFPKSGSSSSSSWQRSDSVIDVLLPRYYEYELDSDFQENPSQAKELEHDDGDSLYAEALLNSDFLAWLNSDDTTSSSSYSSSSTATATSTTTSTALERLRMLVAHASPSSLPPPLFSPPPPFHHDPKGKGKRRQT